MKKFLVIIAALILLLSGFVYKTLNDAGELKRLEYHSDFRCRVVEGVESSEDITIDPDSGMAFISSGMRALDMPPDADRHGAVMGYDLEADNPQLINLTKSFKDELYPHGLGLYTAPDGRKSLFVVNHKTGMDTIEIFDFMDKKLTHRRSVSGELMHNPNDVLPVGPEQFYVSNDHGNKTFNGQMVEDFLQLAKASVLYFDGEKFRTVADKLSYANGVNMSADGKTVYVAETIGHSVKVFRRDIETGDLAFVSRLGVDTGADNIEMDTGGALWIGGHAKLLTFVKHAKDINVLSPSQVLKLTPNGGGGFDTREVYLEDGSMLSGSSVAAPYKNKVLIGAVLAPRFLVCDM